MLVSWTRSCSALCGTEGPFDHGFSLGRFDSEFAVWPGATRERPCEGGAVELELELVVDRACSAAQYGRRRSYSTREERSWSEYSVQKSTAVLRFISRDRSARTHRRRQTDERGTVCMYYFCLSHDIFDCLRLGAQLTSSFLLSDAGLRLRSRNATPHGQLRVACPLGRWCCLIMVVEL